MAVSTQRIMLLVIFLNVLIGFMGEIYNDPTAYEIGKLNLPIEMFEEREQKTTSTETGILQRVTQGAQDLGDTVISPFVWGATFLKIFIKSILPFGIGPWMFEQPLEKMIATFILFLRTGLTMLILLEGYMLIRNKKTS